MKHLPAKVFLSTLLVTLGLFAWSLTESEAQEAAIQPPAIIRFDVALSGPDNAPAPPITVDAIENGEVIAQFTWHAIHVTAQHDLILEAQEFGRWRRIDDGNLPTPGSFTTIITHPLNFGAPAYRLSIHDRADDRVIDSRTLVIDYDDTALEGLQPQIEAFFTFGESVNALELEAGAARLPVEWTVVNRLPSTNLIFEQIFANGEAVLVELPRNNLWIQSHGAGSIAPVLPPTGETVEIRLRVMDVINGEIYAEASIRLDVVGTPPTAAPLPTQDAAAAADTSSSGGNCDVGINEVARIGTPADPCNTYTDPATGAQTAITGFSIDPAVGDPGEQITLTWTTSGANSVIVEMYNRAALLEQTGTVAPVLFPEQSTQGALLVVIPDAYTGGARFVLWAVARTDTGTRRVAYAIMDAPSSTVEISAQAASIPVSVGASYQAFEKGFMIWRNDTNEIIIFTDDGGLIRFPQSEYAQLPDATETITETPPDDLLAPVAGFGKVWANHDGPEILGWATTVEEGFTMRIERFVNEEGKSETVVSMPSGESIRVIDDLWAFDA